MVILWNPNSESVLDVMHQRLFDDIKMVDGFINAGIFLKSGKNILLFENDFDPEMHGVVELSQQFQSGLFQMNLPTVDFVELNTDRYILMHAFIVPTEATVGVVMSVCGDKALMRCEIKKLALSIESALRRSRPRAHNCGNRLHYNLFEREIYDAADSLTSCG